MAETTGFVSFRLPKGDDVLGPLTGGDREIDLLVAPPDRGSGNRLHPFRFIGRGFSSKQVDAMRDGAPVFQTFRTRGFDARTGRWDAEGIIDRDAVASRGLQALTTVLVAFDRPWVHAEGGSSELRLLPLLEDDAFRLRQDVEDLLADHGLRIPVQVSYMDYDTYQRWKGLLLHIGEEGAGAL